MVVNKLDGITFRLNKKQDFTWLKRYGEAFWVVDETGSGCICIGMEKDGNRYFCKIAGVDTIEADVSPKESVEILKNAVQIYRDLAHKNLIKLIESYEYNELYVAVFEWADGDCLFDHWNFEKYMSNPMFKSPKTRFKELSVERKLEAVDVLFDFMKNVIQKGYVAVDFYDGSLMYDFEKNKMTICDIDFFKKAPVVNDIGEDWFGTKRLKAPEEYVLGSAIDEQTNIFTLGALILEIFGEFTDSDIERRYIDSRFIPCELSKWQLDEDRYKVACKAVEMDKNNRWKSFDEFYKVWKLCD